MRYRLIAKVGLDVSAFLVAFIGSFLLRFPYDPAITTIEAILHFVPFVVSIRLACYFIFRLYTTMWRYTGTHDLGRILQATTIGSVMIITIAYFFGQITLPRSIVVMDWFLVVFITGANRMFIRHLFSLGAKPGRDHKSYKRVLIYGAGRAGELLLRNIENTANVKIFVVGFLDDDPVKNGQYLHNKRVLGDRLQIGELVKKYRVDEIYFTIPRLSGSEARAIFKIIQDQAGDEIVVKKTPGLTDLVSGRVSLNELRKFEIRDLLRRKPVRLDFTQVKGLIYNKNVLVVGGGGSIGMELCRQIAAYSPQELVILDNGEYNLYNVESFVLEKYPNLNLTSVISDAANEKQMEIVMREHSPTLVFHAAAYKHVPLMESNPASAIMNNIKSTLVLTELCIKYAVETFILISTDKAVQPTSVMGATKRVCEMITQIHKQSERTKFISVRFGNVLGSSGSVIPRFKKQIAGGGPITVTHPEINRYFMLVSEAVELVLQAGSIGENGHTYVLDMGEPIKIVDLAKLMIELSGLKLDEDIKIVYSGLRPGEKLHKSLYFEGEESATKVPHLFVLSPKLTHNEEFTDRIRKILDYLYTLSKQQIIHELEQLVPEYRPNLHPAPVMTAVTSRGDESSESSTREAAII